MSPPNFLKSEMAKLKTLQKELKDADAVKNGGAKEAVETQDL